MFEFMKKGNKVTLNNKLENDNDAKKVLSKIKNELKDNSYNNNSITKIPEIGTLVTKYSRGKIYMAIVDDNNQVIATGSQKGNEYLNDVNLYSQPIKSDESIDVLLHNNRDVKQSKDGNRDRGRYDVSRIKINLEKGTIDYVDNITDTFGGYERPTVVVKEDKLQLAN